MNISTKAKAKRKVLLVDDEIDVTISLLMVQNY
jgi:hypothetical protein